MPINNLWRGFTRTPADWTVKTAVPPEQLLKIAESAANLPECRRFRNLEQRPGLAARRPGKATPKIVDRSGAHSDVFLQSLAWLYPHRLTGPPDRGSHRVLLKIAEAAANLPDSFTPHMKLGRLMSQRLEAVRTGDGIDWGNAEMLALGSLLLEGTPVRFTGRMHSAARSATAMRF